MGSILRDRALQAYEEKIAKEKAEVKPRVLKYIEKTLGIVLSPELLIVDQGCTVNHTGKAHFSAGGMDFDCCIYKYAGRGLFARPTYAYSLFVNMHYLDSDQVKCYLLNNLVDLGSAIAEWESSDKLTPGVPFYIQGVDLTELKHKLDESVKESHE